MKKRQLLTLALALLMLLSLTACGSGSNQRSDSSAAGSTGYTAAAPMEAEEAMYAADYAAAPEAQSFGMVSNSAAKTDSAGPDAPKENPEKIIYSADATVETTEFDKSMQALDELLAANGGFVESSSINGSNYYESARGRVSRRTASYTLRIPSENFSGMMNALTSLGNVPYTHMYTENVTAQYYDVQARMKAYQAQETRLLEMMELAETVEDIITIEDKLTDVRYRIDSLQANLNNWDRRVSYSTLSLTLQEVQVYTPEAVTRLTYGQELVQAFVNSLKGAGEFFKELLLFLVSAIPTLVILAALFFLCRPLVRKLRARSKARREAKRQKSAPKEPARLETDKSE